MPTPLYVCLCLNLTTTLIRLSNFAQTHGRICKEWTNNKQTVQQKHLYQSNSYLKQKCKVDFCLTSISSSDNHWTTTDLRVLALMQFWVIGVCCFILLWEFHNNVPVYLWIYVPTQHVQNPPVSNTHFSRHGFYSFLGNHSVACVHQSWPKGRSNNHYEAEH